MDQLLFDQVVVRFCICCQFYWNEPLFLEQVIPHELFTFHDDSMDKLTMETFLLLFLNLVFGMALAMLVLAAELFANSKKQL